MRILNTINNKLTGSREAFIFQQEINPEERLELFREVHTDATVENIKVSFYLGHENDLHVQPKIVDPETEMTKDLVDYQGEEEFLKGDDEIDEFSPSKKIDKDSKVGVIAENTTQDHTLTLKAIIEVEYAGGLNRVF